jgi:acetylglutamate kinase
MQPIQIIKIGGNVIDDANALQSFLEKFSKIEGPKILIHGGGKLATELANKLGIEQTLIEGRRLTNADTLDITTMVYCGLINKNIVAKLQALQCNAIGLCGADANIITTSKRVHPTIDYGFVGDINNESINTNTLQFFIENNFTLILNSITHNQHGHLLNTNADTIAASIAVALSNKYITNLTYCFEKNGVLTDVNNNDSYIPKITKEHYETLKIEGVISSGMIPKLDNAFAAIQAGVQQVRICNADNILTPSIATLIV